MAERQRDVARECACRAHGNTAFAKRVAREMPTIHAQGVFDSSHVALALTEIAGLLSFAGKNRFQVMAYEQGARIVAHLGSELGSAVEENRIGQIEGIGPSLSRQIQELWQHGESSLLRRLRAEHPRGAAQLLQIEGMTPRRIRAVAELEIGSAEELLAACEAGRVSKLKGFGKKTEQRLREAAERWLKHETVPEDRRMLRSKALALGSELVERIMMVGAAQRAEIAAGVRRGEEIVSELVIVFLAEPRAVYDALERLPKVVRLDREASAALLVDGVSLRVYFADESNFGDVLLRATGPEAHVRALESLASAHGFDLESHATERAVYENLGRSYLPPELRTGAEGADAAAVSEESLIAAMDLRGAVHCHTNHSDGRNTIEEMARAAQGAGLEYITITDHSQSASYANGLDLDRLRQQWDEIDEVQARVDIRILKGIECDILQDGALDFENVALERLEVVIASIHRRFAMDSAAMTERLVRAMSLPFFKVWGHPLGRILLHRDPIACDLPRVLDALSQAGGAVEISADPHRLDLPSEWLPLARERNIPFVISVDAHSTRGLSAAHHGVTLARRGRVTSAEVLNTLPSAAFLTAVHPNAERHAESARRFRAF